MTKRIDRFFILLAFLVPFVLYLGTLDNALVRDDIYFVGENEWITSAANIPDIVTSPVWDFQGKQGLSNQYRPTYHLFFMAGYALSGTTPWGYHLVNIFMHALSSLMLFLIARRLMTCNRQSAGDSDFDADAGGGASPWWPLAAALLFSLHPINTEPVAWISAISEVSFVFFSLSALYLYISAEKMASWRYSLAVVVYFLAACSKETAAVVPLIFFLSDIFLFRRSTPLAIKRLIPFAVAGALYIVLRIAVLQGVAPLESEHLAGLSTMGLFLNIPPLFIGYLYKLIVPIGLNFDYVFNPVHAISEVRAFFPFILTSALVFSAYALFLFDRKIFFALLWIFIPLIPALYIPALGKNTFTERYLYLSSAGFAVFLVLWVPRITSAGFKKPLATFAIAVILLYSVGTVSRVEVFEEAITLWGDTTEKSPGSRIARNNYGIELAKVERNIEAAEQFKAAIRIDPANDLAYNNLGIIYAKEGKLMEAARHFRTAIDIDRSNIDAERNLAHVLTIMREGDGK